MNIIPVPHLTFSSMTWPTLPHPMLRSHGDAFVKEDFEHLALRRPRPLEFLLSFWLGLAGLRAEGGRAIISFDIGGGWRGGRGLVMNEWINKK